MRKPLRHAEKRFRFLFVQSRPDKHRSFPERDRFGMPHIGGRATGNSARRAAHAFQRLGSYASARESIPAPAALEAPGLSDIVFDPTDMDAMLTRLEDLRQRHRELDQTIEDMKRTGADDIRLMALKREKLRLKDSITWLASRITPDIIA